MSCEISYISSNCNQTPTAAHWGKNNLICYASCNAILIYNPTLKFVTKTLCGHTKRVNSVRWITGKAKETELISGSADKTAIVWSLQGDNYIPFILKGHESNVNIVDGLYKDATAVIVTISMDSTAKIWTRLDQNDNFIQIQSLNFGYNITIAVRISIIPNNCLILALAMDNSKIDLYTETDSDTINFNKVGKLEGHEGWIRGLDFIAEDSGDLLLASCSQDAFIRLWRFSSRNLLSKIKKIESTVKFKDNSVYKIYLESVLYGHEGWIYSVNWSPIKLQLLSASLDKTMIIWEFDEITKLWVDKIRVGEVGGNTLGFYGGLFGPDGKSIMAHSYHGAFHIWRYSEENWKPEVTVGGHFGEVVDIAWEPNGRFLFSSSTDQTTRIHAPWICNNHITWHEIARPQVHGYDMSSLAIISCYKFASSAEEKVIRVFEAPNNFVNNFKRICKLDDFSNSSHLGPEGASVPSLGLSNKAVYENNNDDLAVAKSNKQPFPEESHFTSIELTEPPTEETLIQNTLWPEVQKLYGHGYEVYSLAASPDGCLLASACKATTAEHAAIILWDVSTWSQLQKLVSHTLTVAQMSFSPDSKHLLSVSRDRRWSLFTKFDDGFQLVATTDKKTSLHTRIIWCCAWTHDSKFFATGSRDGKVVVWTKNVNKIGDNILGQYEAASNLLELKGESITALTFAPNLVDDSYFLACGLESGNIILYKWTIAGFKEILMLDKNISHHLTVKKLAFRPVVNCISEFGGNDGKILHLASCSADYSVRIYNINVNNFI